MVHHVPQADMRYLSSFPGTICIYNKKSYNVTTLNVKQLRKIKLLGSNWFLRDWFWLQSVERSILFVTSADVWKRCGGNLTDHQHAAGGEVTFMETETEAKPPPAPLTSRYIVLIITAVWSYVFKQTCFLVCFVSVNCSLKHDLQKATVDAHAGCQVEDTNLRMNELNLTTASDESDTVRRKAHVYVCLVFNVCKV